MTLETCMICRKEFPAAGLAEHIEACSKAELDVELRPYLGVGLGGMSALQHPLVYAVPYFAEMNAHYNDMLAIKTKEIQRASDARDFGAYLFVHERPWRLHAFLCIMAELSDAEYWDRLRDLWVDSENIWQNKKRWARLLRSKRPEREKFMDDEERAALAALPDVVTVYRGYHKGRNRSGLSFSLSEEIARKVGHRRLLKRQGGLWRRRAPRGSIFAYLKSRGEEEIILLD